jgi:hypothetical protein
LRIRMKRHGAAAIRSSSSSHRLQSS